jgi:hypothetical protein
MRILLAGFACAGLAPAAMACAFHTVPPQPSMVDLALMAEDVAVLDGDGVQAVWKGNPAGALDARPADTSGRVLVARPDPYGPWEKLAALTPALDGVLRAALDRSDAWLYAGDTARGAFFAGLLGHPAPEVRRLALRELDLLNYGVLRQVVAGQEAGDAADLAADPDLVAIAALLDGLAGGADAADRQTAAVRAALDDPGWGRVLGAHAVALVESAGPDGVATLDRLVLRDPARPADQVELVVEALAIQRAEGDPALRPAIDAALAAMIAARPETAGGVARQLGARADWSQLPALRGALANRHGMVAADMIAISAYVGAALDELDTTESRE